ncbi:DUF7507 domain-containing protein [Myroides marinus]|uniref:DUF7507 domain-containing protein n=1 Tax=Myroides marinus TaxID=703342 RepID=UPI0025771A28|nr:hypothetical protein [Myroides marinus]MDM1371505.1 hypothetical protein [Myroides marinus]MDM1376603.1 hypothetical protein [Myroides marinus]
MIYTIINKITTKALFTLVLVLGVSTAVLADGSRNLYPSGVSGHRAFLLGKGYTSPEAIPFPNEGAHYVYAKVGETITLASSAQGTDAVDRRGNYIDKNGGITLYGPDGSIIINQNQTEGQISNRAAELAGPRLTATSSGGYTPIYHLVKVEGIYRIEFASRSTSATSAIIYANNTWTQGTNAAIAAWDVSIIDKSKTKFIEGRVYTTNLNFTNGNDNSVAYESVNFNGHFFVRTNDGFTYRVKHKGSSGIVWAFFVNNNGFFDYYTKNSLYKSMNMEASQVIHNIHNPNTPDDTSNITHKIYYTLPATDMPASAKVNVSSGSINGLTTWLNPKVIEPEVSNVKIIGAEGTLGIFGHKGGYIEFDAPVSGQQFTIDIMYNGSVFKKLEGNTIEGHNKIYWNGVGTNGQKLKGTVPIDLNVQLQGAEVHFPFFDMEYNKGGIVIELLDYNNYNKVISDLVFWDDTDITEGFYEQVWNGRQYVSVWRNYTVGNKVDPIRNTHVTPGNKGISSNTNGHKWGEGGSGAVGTFGDRKSMDTWTFRVGNKKEVKTNVVIKEADLYTTLTYKVGGVVNKGSGNKGDNVEYTIVAGNKGPSDIIADKTNGIHGAPFSFTLPPGVDVINPISVKAIVSNGATKESVALTYDPLTRTFRSELQIPNGETVTYKVTGVLNGMTGSMIAESTIMRPADVSDPDATNGDSTVKPTNPHFECYNNDSVNLPGGSGSIGCNNIQEVVFMALGECVDQILYFEDFDRGYWNVNSGRTDWMNKASISIDSNTGAIMIDGNGRVVRQGPIGGATSSYLFAPGMNDSRYASANRNPHSETISVARIKNGYYSVNPPGYVQMGIPTTDSWSEGIWVPNAPTNDPTLPNSNFDWTPAWDKVNAIRDMSGAVNGSAFLIRGAASAAQSIKPFYEFEVNGRIEKDRIYTLDIYSYVTYHDKDYMLMDVVDKETGHIYASVPLKYPGPGLPEGASPEGFSLGWVPLTASFTFADAECVDVLGREVKIAIRGSQDRALDTGKGFGHTLIDNITFSKRTANPSCGIHVSNITCADECYQDIVGKGFGWFYKAGAKPNGTNVVEKFEQPATDGGFVVDIYRLDNSFNMIINGVPLYKEELEFETGHANRNVRFKSDKKRFGEDGVNAVWNVNKHPNGIESDVSNLDLEDRLNNPTPVIRVNIDKWGNVTLFGKRNTNAALEELEVYDRNNNDVVVPLQVVHWISEGTGMGVNKVDVTQNVIGQTMMYGFGYGQQQKECETCTLEKDGIFADENGNTFAEVGETITYTFKVKNAGDMDISDIEIIDELFGFNIKLDETTHQPIQTGVTLEGDKNNDGVLNRNETWTFTVSYQVTQDDIYVAQGVYNQATVIGVGKLPRSKREVEELSTDPTPYKEGDKGWDPLRAYHTYVPLEGSGLLITNPHIYQRVK